MYIDIHNNGKNGITLVHDDNGEAVRPGELVEDGRGGKFKVMGFILPRHTGSTGRIDVKPPHALYTTLYYPGVCGLKILVPRMQEIKV